MAAVVACPGAERRSIPIGGTANLKPGDLNSRSALAILNERLRDECPYSRWKGRRGVYPGDTTMKSRTRNPGRWAVPDAKALDRLRRISRYRKRRHHDDQRAG